jgi:hypothetical protein
LRLIRATDASSGNILFGGVDTAKYHGDLVALPIQADPFNSTNTPANTTSFNVLLDNIQIAGNQQKVVYSSQLSVPVVLDSGTSFAYLPDPYATTIANGVGAVTLNQTVVVPCSVASTPATLKFQFGNSNGPVIEVGVGQFVIPIPADEEPIMLNGKAACQWALLASSPSDSSILFGDAFMRSAYFVYDLDGQTVAMAQTNFNATTSSVKVITKAGEIPGVSSTAMGTAPIATGAAPTGTIGTATFDLGTPTATASSGKKNAGSSLQPPSRSITAAVAGGMAVFCALIGGSLLTLI